MKIFQKGIAWAAALGLASSAQAFDWFGGRLSIGGGYGVVDPESPERFRDADENGQAWAGHLQYFVSDTLSLRASYMDFTPDEKIDGAGIRFRPVTGALRVNVIRGLPVTPYLVAGAGVSFNKRDVPNQSQEKWNKVVYQGGLGLEFFLNQGASIGAEALYHNIRGGGAGETRYGVLTYMGMVNFYFGEGPLSKKEREERKQAEEAARRQAEEAQRLAQEQAEAARRAQEEAARNQQAAQDAQAKAQAAQAQIQAAQVEVDRVKDMIAQKDIQPVNFETGRATLLASSSETLDRVADIAKKYPDLKLRIEGHTDDRGSNSFNVKLSQERADAVKAYLTGKGVNEAQLTSKGFGETQPVADNTTEDGRAHNRRVEFIFYI